MSTDPALRYVYWRFVVLGMATLMAWNVYITASDFFRHEFRSTFLHDNFESIFSILSNTINLFALTYALYTQPTANNNQRIRHGLFSTVGVFIALIILPLFGIDGWLAVVVSLLALCVAAVAAAFIQCSIFGIAATLDHPCYAEGYMGGQAIAGTVASAVQLVTVYLESEKVEDEGRVRAVGYFGVAMVFAGLSTVAWSQVSRQPMVARQLGMHCALATDDGGEAGAADLMGRMQQGSPRLARNPDEPAEAQAFQDETDLDQVNGDDRDIQKTLPKWLTALGLSNAPVLYQSFTEVTPHAIICALAMCVTLSLFPPLTEAIVSSPQSTPRIAHLTAWHFFVFNVGDYLGRLSTQWIECSGIVVLNWVGAARLLFVPALLMFPTKAMDPADSVVVCSDLAFLALVLVLGWSNGWVATMALVLAPREASNKALAGSVLSFAMCVGLMAGAFMSYPILLIANIT